jgi:hypothetical protein
MKTIFVTLFCLLLAHPVLAGDGGNKQGRHPAPDSRESPGQVQQIPSCAGIYVVNGYANEASAKSVYAAGLTSSPAYQDDITGHAIFVPIAKILPSITTWGQFSWTWGYLDTLVQIAVSNGKKFSIALISGLQTSGTYLESLPAGFAAGAGVNSAPLFDVWIVGGKVPRCISSYVLLPWVPKVQEFWSAAAFALADHLQKTGTYGSLTMVHVPGLLVYDEELRLPTGYPRPLSTDTVPCADGRIAFPAVINDADTSRWRSLGYSDTAAINGFKVIASAFAEAFPDRILGLSLFPVTGKVLDYPNLTGDTLGYVASQIVRDVNALAPGRVEVQADDLDANFAQSDVMKYGTLYSDVVGWQTNAKGGTGAGCSGGGPGSCDPDGPTGPYFQLLQNGSHTGGRYVEVWSDDVVSYPQSFAAAKSAGFYQVTGVQTTDPIIPAEFDLLPNYPNPFNPATEISYLLPEVNVVTLKVFDVLGREVATVVNERKPAGSYTVRFDASGLASGVYIYRLTAGAFIQSRRMMLVK